MANKYLDLAGLEHLWDKIEDEVSTAADNAKADMDNKLKSYLPLSGTATAATKLSNTTAIGSATQPVYFSADGVPVATTYTLGASVPSGAVFTDEKVSITATAPSTATTYYPVWHTGTSGSSVNLNANDGFVYNTQQGTAEITGTGWIILGNGKNAGTSGNKSGKISLYSTGTNYHNIEPMAGTNNATHKLPATSGTILNTGTTSFTQTLTSGTEIGTVKINSVETKLYAPTNTDEKVKATASNPTNTATYFIPFMSSAGTSGVGINNGIRYTSLEGTTSANGQSILTLGNSTATGTAGNKYGVVRIYGKNTYYTDILASDTLSANRTLTLPNGSGRLALASEITDEKVKVTATNPTTGTWYYPVWYTGTSGTGGVNANDGLRYYSLQGTTSANGQTILSIGNATANGTAGNKYGQLRIYSASSGYGVLMQNSTTEALNHYLPTTGGRILNTGTTSFTQSLTSGTHIGTIKIDGTETKIYAPTNTDTHYTTGLKVGASATATANAAAPNGYVYLNVLDNTTVRDSHNIVGSGATTVTSDANGKITISSTNTTYNAATTSANGLMSSTDKAKLDCTNVAFATCATAAGTAEKVVTISDNSNWKLTTGSMITVLYTYSNTASSVTLNVNNTGAKEIYYNNAKYTGNSTMICGATNRCITYMYSGVCWVWISSGIDNNTTYSNFVKSGTGAKAGLVPAPSTTAGTTKFLCEDGTWAVPPDTDTHYTSHLYVGASGDNANATTATSNPYLLCVDNTTNRNSIQLKAGTNMSVSAINGVVTFAAKDTATTVSKGTDGRYSITTSVTGIGTSEEITYLNYANIAYGTCPTAAATAAKVVTTVGDATWTLMAGSTIVVKFTYTNTAQNPTLNVNGTGAKSIWYNTALITTSALSYAGTANRPMKFVYDGTQYVFMGWAVDTNSDTKVTQTLVTTTTGTKYPMLFAPTGQSATATTTANFFSNLYYDSSAKKLITNGNISAGSATDTDRKGFWIKDASGTDRTGVTLNPSTYEYQVASGEVADANGNAVTPTIMIGTGTTGDVAAYGTWTFHKKIKAANIITGTKTITVNSATAYTSTALTSTDLGFTPTANTSVVVSLRKSSTPSPLYFNVYSLFYNNQILLCLTNGAASSTTVPAATYYIDYIVTNNA